MTRFWVLLGGLLALNLTVALAITLWLPESVARGPSPSTLFVTAQPMVTIPRNRSGFESRVRNLIHREVESMGLEGRADPQVRRDIDRMGGITTTGRTQRRSQLDTRPEVSALLTPYGVYRAGPPGLLMALVSLASFLAAGIAATYVAPVRLARVRNALSSTPRRTARLGAIGLLGYLLALSLLFITVALVTGILLAVLLAILLAAATFAGLVVVALTAGRWLRKRLAPAASSPLAELTLGVLAVFPLGLIPWVGWFFALLFAALGFGALLATRFGSEEAGWSLDPLRGTQPIV